MGHGKYEKWLEPENLILVEGWARDGLTDEQIAHNMGCSYSTFRVWRDKFSALSAALKKGKEVADYEVEGALFMSATGYKKTLRKPMKLKEEKTLNGKGKIVTERIEYVEEEIFIPPNTAAQIFWLKNRRPSKWSDKPQIEVVDEVENSGLIEALSSNVEQLFSDGDDSGMLPQEET